MLLLVTMQYGSAATLGRDRDHSASETVNRVAGVRLGGGGGAVALLSTLLWPLPLYLAG